MDDGTEAYVGRCEACGERGHTVADCGNRDAFRQWLAERKENYFQAWTDMVWGASLAYRKEAVGDAAEIYGWSRTRAASLGEAWDDVPDGFRWMPEQPLSAIRAALDAPWRYRKEALQMVADGASARDIRDYYDLTFYKRKVSRVPWLDGRAEVVAVVDVDDGRARVLLEAQRPTGQQPEAVQVRAYRVLQLEDDDA